MDVAFEIARVLTIAAFLGYGATCLLTQHMVAEFERYGLAPLRVLTGSLEVLGALGLLGSYLVPALAVWAAGGLCLLMAMGVGARVRIRDPLIAMAPALLFLVLNGFLLLYAVTHLPTLP